MSNCNAVSSSLIDLIYGAAMDSSQWPAFLAQFSAAFDGNQSTFFSHDLDNLDANFHAYSGIAPEFVSSYVDYYSKKNIFVDKSKLVAEGEFISTESLVERRVYEQSEFFNDWVKPQGCREFATTNLARTDRVLTGITVLRGDRPFTDDEIGRWRMLVPHLQRAVQIHRQIHQAHIVGTATLDAFDRLAIGVIVARADATILFSNRQARRIIGMGRNLRVRHNRLAGETVRSTGLLQDMIAGVSDPRRRDVDHSGGVLALPSRAHPPLSILVSPLRPDCPATSPLADHGALILVSDPVRRRPISGADLAAIYGLTPAEAKLLSSLIEGRSIAEHAAVAGITVHTARTHLKHIFHKTGSRRQSDMVRHVLTNPLLSHGEE